MLDDLSPNASPVHTRRELNGIRIHYVSMGEGPLLVLLHGWPQTWHAWRKVIPLLAARYRVVAPDLRGCGSSSKPFEGYDKKTVARDIRELVASLGEQRFTLAGHDMGGQVAYACAAQWPDDVERLVFIESGLPGHGQERAMNVAEGGSWHFGFNMAGDIAEALVRDREHLFVEYFLRRDNVGAVDPGVFDQATIDVYANALKQPGALRSGFSYYRTLLQDASDNVVFGKRKLPMPVLAISAEHGYRDGARRTMEAVAERVHGVIIPGCGHYPAEEKPVELARLIDGFIAETWPAAGA
jgi:pimeloyl-ACP methyl ester carboxylesterase